MHDLVKKKNYFRLEIIVINLTILCFIFRMSVPFLKYPFILFYFVLIAYALINYRKQLITSIKVYFHAYELLILLILLLFVSFLFSNKLYLMVFKDGANIFILLSVFFLMNLIISSRKELDIYVKSLINLIILFAILISFNVLGNLFNIFSEGQGLSLLGIPLNPSNISEKIDNNFGVLPVIYGLIALIYFLIISDSLFQKVTFNSLLIIFSISIFLSGSRRGLIAFTVIIMAITIIQIVSLIRRKENLLRIRSRLLFFICSIFFLTISSWYITTRTPYTFKNNFLEFIGCKNLSNTKLKITTLICRINLAINRKTSFPEIYNLIWTPGFYSEDPESTWGTINHKTIFPLIGDNVGIVPNGAKGNLIDSTCNSDYSSEGDYTDCISSLVNLKVNIGERYKVSIYCYVSGDFNADVVRLTVPTDHIIQKKVLGNAVSIYDLSKKDTWKKLEIEFECYESEVPIYISFLKRGVKDFSHLKGYIIFAYPTYEKINKSENGLSFNINKYKGTDHDSSVRNYFEKELSQNNKDSINKMEKKSYSNNYYPICSYIIPDKFISCSPSSQKIQKYYSAGFVFFPLSSFFGLGSLQKDPDPIRNLASKFISEDTTYYSFKSNIVADTISNSFSSPRIARWSFAIKIFTKEYSLSQQIFGSGFNFLNWYGYVFYGDKTRSDYPHNPFLSVLLYSGIVGLIFYLILMYKVFYYYIKYLKEYKIIAIFFIITFYFSFFSAGNPFDPPMMGFFVILPFFIHHIHKKNKSELTEGKNEH